MAEFQEEKTDLEVDDKIRIVSEDGFSHNVKIFVGEKEFRHVEKIDIEIVPNSLIKAKLKVSSTKLDIEAAVFEIEKERSISGKIKSIIDKLPEPKKWKGIGKRDKAYEAIFDIIGVLYPNGDRVYPE